MDIFDVQPETLQQAVNLLLELPDAEEAVSFCKDANSFCAKTHSTIGRTIRNEWGLWEGCVGGPVDDFPLYYWFYNKGLRHPDDMSGCILRAVWHEVIGIEYDLAKDIKRYQTYWNSAYQNRFDNITDAVERVIKRYSAPQLTKLPHEAYWYPKDYILGGSSLSALDNTIIRY